MILSRRHLDTACALALLLLLWNCEEQISGTLNENIPPQTTIFLNSGEDTLNATASTQTLYWDGIDPDGFVTGFLYTWEEDAAADAWLWTTERTLTFPLQIAGSDTAYLFRIKAVDNQDAEDPTPAAQRFPIINSPPQVNWALGSQIPDTTFTVASFEWSASDPDGDSTIVGFEYSLDDTSSWISLAGSRRDLTLNIDQGITEGDHALYLRAVDVAGARSRTIRMPENEAGLWNVKSPNGRYLLIDDFGTNLGSPDSYYRTMMSTVLSESGEDFSYWDIDAQFPASLTQFTETLKLFERIVWYSDFVGESDDHFIAAQVAIPEFRANGGKIIYNLRFNLNFGAQGSPLAFSPVDSLGDFFQNGIANGGIYYPDPAFAAEFPTFPPLPELSVSTFIVGIFGLIPRASSVPMYRYAQGGDPADDAIFVMAGKNDNTNEFDFVFSGTPLHFLRGNGNLDDFFRIVFTDLFGD